MKSVKVISSDTNVCDTLQGVVVISSATPYTNSLYMIFVSLKSKLAQ